MNIVLLGAPGSGKGTLAAKLKARYRIPHIPSGDIIRAEIANKTAFGQQVAEIISKGQLLPDAPEFMGRLFTAVRLRLCQKDCQFGFILDGIPRRAQQVNDLTENLALINKKIDAVILLDVSRQTLLARITGRIVCQKCSLNYHKLFKRPKQENTCDACKGVLITRSDDNEQVGNDRLDIYYKEIPEIIRLYPGSNFICINGEADEDQVFNEVTKFLFPRDYLASKIQAFKNDKNINIYNLIEIYKNPPLTLHIIEEFTTRIKEANCDYLAAPEARALPIFGALMGKTSLPGIFIRKNNKLPQGLPRHSASYQTAYSEDALEMYADPNLKGSKVAVIDDGISTGGTTLAAIELLEKAGMEIRAILAPVSYHYAERNPKFSKWEKSTTTLFDLGIGK